MITYCTDLPNMLATGCTNLAESPHWRHAFSVTGSKSSIIQFATRGVDRNLRSAGGRKATQFYTEIGNGLEVSFKPSEWTK
jgi:hypothetical protein